MNKLIIAVIALLAVVTSATAASFQGLNVVQANTISPDGNVIFCRDGAGIYSWTTLDGLAGMSFSIPSGQTPSISASNSDGSLAVGSYVFFGLPKSFKWTEAEGSVYLFDPLFELPPCNLFNPYARTDSATAISSDGSVIVGVGDDSSVSPDESFILIDCDVSLLDELNEIANDRVTDISDDGGIIVGNIFSTAGAIRWSGGTGFEVLPPLVQGLNGGAAAAISGDGSTIVGWSSNDQWQAAVRWTGGGAFDLGLLEPLAPGNPSHFALDVNQDGSVIVGKGVIHSGPGFQQKQIAFIWTEASGIRSLKDVLESDHGLDLTGWELTEAIGISADGTVIIGNGKNPAGGDEGWRAVVPFVLTLCPADIMDATASGPDGTVNVFDLLELLANWGSAGNGADIAPPTNIVDVFDLLDLIAAWGDC